MSQPNFSGWFCGPSAESANEFSAMLQRIYNDYVFWRRNYFPNDGYVIDSQSRREGEQFQDMFEDRLTELLGRLKSTFPFHSPRYAGHMIAEQTLPSIAGMVAGILYNPNNVSNDAAPVTVELEFEVSRMIADMVGYGDTAWAHLTSGGTVANIESLWIARSTRFLPFVIRDVAQKLNLDIPEKQFDDKRLLKLSPTASLQLLQDCFMAARAKAHPDDDPIEQVLAMYRESSYNVAECGLAPVCSALNVLPIFIAPETAHYSILKAADLLGIGRRSVVLVPVDSEFRMEINGLKNALDVAHTKGQTVLSVVAIVGSTEEGAIDPIDKIVEVREQQEAEGKSSFWIHGDAAYGGYLRTMTIPARVGLGEPNAKIKIAGTIHTIETVMPPKGACDALEKLGECDSVSVDPHKLGYIPYPAGAVCFKSDLVKPLVRQSANYLHDNVGGPSEERTSRTIGLYALEGSKPGAVAAAVWLSHTLIPLDRTGHGMLMRETVRNACELYSLLMEYPNLRSGQKVKAIPLCVPGSNIVCFVFVPVRKIASLADINVANRLVYENFTIDRRNPTSDQKQQFFVSRTVLTRGQYSHGSVENILNKVGASTDDFKLNGLFLLRSVLMNPWYSAAKRRDRYFLSEFVEELYRQATKAFDAV